MVLSREWKSREICCRYKSFRGLRSAFLSPLSGDGATVIGRPEAGFIRHPHQSSWTELNLRSSNMPPKFDPTEVKVGMFLCSEGSKCRSWFSADTEPPCLGFLRASWPAGLAHETVKIGNENPPRRTRMVVFLLWWRDEIDVRRMGGWIRGMRGRLRAGARARSS